MPSLKEQVCEINEALKERTGWEQELARSEAQRKCLDRAKVNNNPWPRASNVRYPLSDTLISQFTPFLYKILYASERIAYMRAMSAQNHSFAGVTADWLDFKTKNETDLEEEIQPCIDKYLQDGETILKIMWDDKKETWEYEHVDNLFFITPSTTLVPLDRYAPWCVHVLQKSPKWVKKHFKDVEGIEDLVERIKDGSTMVNDQGQREETEYQREGINISPKNKLIVLWEKHYRTEDGKHRIVTLSPDDPEFDFEDDREYTHEIGGYMFEHTRWEKLDRKMHSSRGIPRLVMEGEFTLTALERSKQNSMTLYNTPVMWSTGTAPVSTQNITWSPGTLLPFPVEVAKMGEPPISWDIEMNAQRSKWERRVGSPDYGIGKANTQNDSRTATEVKAIGFQNSQAVDLITGNWRMFLAKVFKKAWAYVVSAKPKQLQFFLNGKNVSVPEAALNDEWQISIVGTAESVNRETMTQKAITLWQMMQNNQYANLGEGWKNVLQNVTPGEVDRFFIDPAARQQQQTKKTASDISVIMSTGYPMLPDPNDDLLTAGMTAFQFLQGQAQKGAALNPQQVNLVSQYIAACREGLKHTNPQGYQQLNQVLNQADLQSRQQAQVPPSLAAPQSAPALNGSTGVGGAPAPSPQTGEQPVPPANVIPMKKEFRKSITLTRNPDGSLKGARIIGMTYDEMGNPLPQMEQKNVNFVKNPDGTIKNIQVEGTDGGLPEGASITPVTNPDGKVVGGQSVGVQV